MNLGVGASLVVQTVKNLPAMHETGIWSLSWEDPLEEGMATHSSPCLENSTGRGARWATVHGVAESNTTVQLTLPLFTNIHAETHIFEFFWRHLWFPESFGEQECNSIVTRFSFQAADIYSTNLVQGKQRQIPLNSHLPNLILRHNDGKMCPDSEILKGGGGSREYVHLRIDEIWHITKDERPSPGDSDGSK